MPTKSKTSYVAAITNKDDIVCADNKSPAASKTISCLFVIAATCLVLLFVGIHNAWDTVTYIAIGRAANNNVSTSEKPSQTGS